MRTTGTGGIHGVAARMLAPATTHAYAARMDGCSAPSSVAYDSGTMPCTRSVSARIARVVAFGSISSTRIPASALSHSGRGAAPTGSHGIGSTKRNVLPFPCSLSNVTLPPIPSRRPPATAKPGPAVAARVGGVGLREWIEDQVAARRIDADAGITHFESDRDAIGRHQL